MNKRLCICVGVSECSDPCLGQLPGTEVDAKAVFTALTDKNLGDYSASHSIQMINPSKAEMLEALAALSYQPDLDTLTIYFAGHGVIVDSVYYLCCRDMELGRAAYTGLSLTEIFHIVGNAKPPHTNIIIDACHAAGIVHDVQSLLKPQEIGSANSFGVSVLAMSATDQFAGEAPPDAITQGGYGTLAMLKCLRGETDCRVNKTYLSLDDISKAIDLGQASQTPSSWSFNITGSPRFCRNLVARSETLGSIVSIPAYATSDSPTLSAELSDELWKRYLEAKADLGCRDLQDCLEKGLLELASAQKQANFLLGLLDSFTARSAFSEDGFATPQITAVFLFVAQKITDESVANTVSAFILTQLELNLGLALESVRVGLKEEFFLARNGGGYSDFFSLPIRISKIAAWSLVYLDLAGSDAVDFATRLETCKAILDALERDYSSSFSLLSEEQAANIIIISALAKRFGFTGWAERYLGSLYFDYFAFKGRVARTSLDISETYEFMKYRCLEEKIDYARFSARPSELLFSLFAHYWNFELLDAVRYDFAEIDGTHCTTYVPENYADFSDEVISHGGNVGFHIGHDVFTVSDFDLFMSEYLTSNVRAATQRYDPAAISTAICASLIYPDRIAWCAMGRLTDEVF